MSIEGLDGNSFDVKQEKLNKLKEFMPEIFSENKIDLEKFKNFAGIDLNINNERYVLNWAGKSDAIQALQTPTTATLEPCKDESINFEETENIFIEGENLEVLKVLQKSYFNKIKMIYIDPPYNTGNDSFIYPDKFSENKEEYLQRIDEKDEEGYLLKEVLFKKNSRENGQYHSNWLSMMYPRLYMARNLLKEDGVIFISIDDNEIHNLKLMMNEIFGEENFVGQFIWRKTNNPNTTKNNLGIEQEYILCYAKINENYLFEKLELSESALSEYLHSDNKGKYKLVGLNKTGTRKDRRENLEYTIIAPDGKEIKPKPRWRWEKQTFDNAIKENRIIFNKNNDKWTVYYKQYLNENNQGDEIARGIMPYTILLDEGTTTEGSNTLTELLGTGLFDFPKPPDLLKYLIKISVQPNDIILDFFSGSGTTAHACLDLNKEDGGNRKFICVQLPEKTNESSEAYKAGYKTIADIGKERIRRVIKKINEEKSNKLEITANKQDLGFKVFKLKSSNFKIWRNDFAQDEEQLVNQLNAFENPVKQNSLEENMLWELLIKSGYDLNTKIEKKTFDSIKYYSIADNQLIVILLSITEALIDEIIKESPKNCVCLDNLFENNDQLKTNTALQMREAKILFKTI